MPKTVTPAEAAQTLRIGRNFLYDLLHSGKLKGRKRGKQWRIPEHAIRERQERLAAVSSR